MTDWLYVMLQAQPAQQLQEHQMPDLVPAAVVALDQASSTTLQTWYSIQAKLKLQRNGMVLLAEQGILCLSISQNQEQCQSMWVYRVVWCWPGIWGLTMNAVTSAVNLCDTLSCGWRQRALETCLQANKARDSCRDAWDCQSRVAVQITWDICRVNFSLRYLLMLQSGSYANVMSLLTTLAVIFYQPHHL